MTTFLFVRHAAHDWLGRGLAGRMPSVSLNAQGWLQAEALVGRLEPRPVHAIYSSPQPRARQTVGALAARRRLQVQVEPAFDEIDFGEWTGREFDSLRDDPGWQIWNARRSTASPPGGEAFEAVRRRAMAGVEALRLHHPDRTVLVASHADVIKAVVASVLGLSLDALESFEVAPASLSVVEAGEGWRQLRLLNSLAN
ncbi:MAG TPA: histidine phosphatase family protein [Ramlibacter sp.]|uniref:histidine phosphatase family protein n=1 Tax=Ramlibacter sp. TaxID=1917967 RepID=UPI002D30EE5E|nr:histidine phosphatase family protein [Ramlibacter sp.]HZY17914.1 histidine phosphatase family protein [Ramlibacter sp.]